MVVALVTQRIPWVRLSDYAVRAKAPDLSPVDQA